MQLLGCTESFQVASVIVILPGWFQVVATVARVFPLCCYAFFRVQVELQWVKCLIKLYRHSLFCFSSCISWLFFTFTNKKLLGCFQGVAMQLLGCPESFPSCFCNCNFARVKPSCCYSSQGVSRVLLCSLYYAVARMFSHSVSIMLLHSCYDLSRELPWKWCKILSIGSLLFVLLKTFQEVSFSALFHHLTSKVSRKQ